MADIKDFIGFGAIGLAILLLINPSIAEKIQGKTDTGVQKFNVECDVKIGKGVTTPTLESYLCINTKEKCGGLLGLFSLVGAEGSVRLRMNDGEEDIKKYDIGVFQATETVTLKVCTGESQGKLFLYDQKGTQLRVADVTIQ